MLRKGLGCAATLMRNKNYDPIEQLLETRNKLVLEIQYQEDVRSSKIVRLNANGNRKAHNEELHMNLYDKLTKIDESLLRYGYSRVSEIDKAETPHIPSLQIHLTSKDDVVTIYDNTTPRTE